MFALLTACAGAADPEDDALQEGVEQAPEQDAVTSAALASPVKIMVIGDSISQGHEGVLRSKPWVPGMH